MKVNKREVFDLLKAWIAISVAFAIVLSQRNFSSEFFTWLGIALLTAGIGFVVHELSHRYWAKRFKCYAEFRSNDIMLVVAIALSFAGFVFAAPGAVWFSGYVNKNQRGIISMSGPLANIIIALIFLPFVFVIPWLALPGMLINAWLAFFNLLPFRGFDGIKVFEWNRAIYIIMIIMSVGLTFLSFAPEILFG
ncbi:MAG: metalloprotease [archaeon]